MRAKTHKNRADSHDKYDFLSLYLQHAKIKGNKIWKNKESC